MINKVGLIGRGAVGSMYALMMQKYLGKDNFFILVDENRKKKYEEQHFYVNDEKTNFHYVSNIEECNTLDLIFIVCKYPNLKNVIETIRPFVGEETIIVSLLNGVISEEIVEKALGKGIVIHSIAQLMDAVMNANKVTYTQSGEIVLGICDEKRKMALHKVVSFLEKVGISYKISEDIMHDQWSKLMLNCALNQICMVYDVPYKECQSGGLYQSLFLDVMREVSYVASKEGILLSEEEIIGWQKAVDKLSPKAMPSMRQDYLAKRYSEVDLFSKTILDLAKKHNLKAPLNEKLYKEILEIEKNY